MKFSKEHTEYTLKQVTTAIPHTVDIDRALINLYPLLKYEGKAIPRAFQQTYSIDMMTDHICKNNQLIFQNFSSRPELVSNWLLSDFFLVSLRGKKGKEKIAAPVPLHLNAFKLRSGKETKDYGLSEQIFTLLYYSNIKVLRDLRDFLYEGVNEISDKFDPNYDVDIESLLLLRILDLFPADSKDTASQTNYMIPTCLGQGSILSDDIERLLTLKKKIPRLVMIRHIKNIIAFNMGIYLNKLAMLISYLVEHSSLPGSCSSCSDPARSPKGLHDCPFKPKFITDMGDGSSRMAQLARGQFNDHVISYSSYVRANIYLRKLFECSIDLRNRGKISKLPENIYEIMNIKEEHSGEREYELFFYNRSSKLFDESKEFGNEMTNIFQRSDIDGLEKYTLMLYELRLKYHLKSYERAMDSLFQKNTENGFLKAGFGPYNKRRYSISSGLLETFVELAALKLDDEGKYQPTLIRIDEFIDLLEERYGIYIQRLPNEDDVTIFDLEALRLNVVKMKEKLRDIGYYKDLSDAYISQTIRSRYMNVEGEK